MAGALNGIEPVWASEIEPYPIAVTRSRFPGMKHLGSVTDIDGAKIEPVDIITFGSPCQDLSVAGNRAGIFEGSRSNLFFEATRIIKEMRKATNGEYPKYIVWENVPGAFSSNKGEDFHAVLTEISSIKGQQVSIPRPPHGKWSTAGEIMGDGFSIAWRVLDAQYWGVPQRRRRIYLVADFRNERASEILFEREGLHGNTAPGREAGKEATRVVGDGIARSNKLNYINPICYTQNKFGEYAAGVGTLTTANSSNISKSNSNVVCMAHGQEHAEIYKDKAPNLTCKHEQPIVAWTYQNTGIGWWNESPIGETLRTPAGGDSIKSNLAVELKSSERYIVRRLTPTECCRLQGFPDGWGIPDEINSMPSDDCQFWESVRVTYANMIGKTYKQCKTPEQLMNWYNKLHTDTAEYKMWGNGIALPCAAFVLAGVAHKLSTYEKEQ